MKITHSKFFKYTFVLLVVLWWLITLHVFYVYISYVSPKTPVKWWTFVQWTFEPVSFLPYTSLKNDDKLYQSFLFNWCLSPYVSGSQILFEEDLCTIKTTDFQNFTISIKDGKKWSDGIDLSINDIYFTYNSILKENLRWVAGLESFQNIEVKKNEDLKSISVKFPTSSIDNNIFFTNYILPAHVLAENSMENYITSFSQNPIKTWCGSLQRSNTDYQSLIFDLSQCPDNYIKYYQVKNFNNFQEFANYVKKNGKSIIDLYISDELLDWFKDNKIILNKFITIFFNTSSDKFNNETRKSLLNFVVNNIYTWDYENYFIKDRFLFDETPDAIDIATLLKQKTDALNNKTTTPPKTQTWAVSTWTQNGIVNLPRVLMAGPWNNKFYLSKLDWSFNLKFQFWGSFDKVVIERNWWGEYILKSYKAWDNTANYNLSETYKNISQWKNTYKIIWYKWKKATEIMNIEIYYIDKPKVEAPKQEVVVQTPEVTTWEVVETNEYKLKIIYLNSDKNSQYVISKLKDIFEQKWILDYFEFKWYDSADEYNWKLSSKDYDITIRWVDMWLKKDISWLFSTDDPITNPSVYKNNDFSSLINQYFTTRWNKEHVKKEIDTIYKKEAPFIVLWKSYGSIKLRSDLKIEYPKRLYEFWFSKDVIKDLKLIYTPYFDTKRIFNSKNFLDFISDYWILNKDIEF